LPADAARLARTIRSHWGIENRLHWALDVVLREDDCRVHAEHAPQNFALIRHFALTRLRHEHSHRTGLATKRLRAARDDTYLRSVLAPVERLSEHAIALDPDLPLSRAQGEGVGG